MPSEKLLTTTGKMPAARWVRMSTSGQWLLNNFLIANQMLARSLPALLLLRKLLPKAAQLLAKRQNLLLASPAHLLKNLNNFRIDFCKKTLALTRVFLWLPRCKYPTPYFQFSFFPKPYSLLFFEDKAIVLQQPFYIGFMMLESSGNM